MEKTSQIENELKVNPRNSEAWYVYSDYLQLQGDIHGELIALGLAIDQCTDFSKLADLQASFNLILKPYITSWLNYMSYEKNNPGIFTHEWQYGYIMKAEIWNERHTNGLKILDVVKKLLDETAGRFIQELDLELITQGNMIDDSSANIVELAKLVQQSGIKKLVLDGFDEFDYEISTRSVGNCEPIYAALPNLESLLINGSDIVLGNLNHKNLKYLTIKTAGLSANSINSLIKGRLPALETLEVWFGSTEYGAEGDISMLAPLLAGHCMPNLKQLGLMCSEFQNDIANAIVTAPILTRLETLDLSRGNMSDDGASILLENLQKLRHLKNINLELNFISEKMQSLLSSKFGNSIKTDNQKTLNLNDDSGHYYVSF